jgi:hypothetical protein
MLLQTLGQMTVGGPQRSKTLYEWPAGWMPGQEGWTHIGDNKAALFVPGQMSLGSQQSGALQGTQRWRRDEPISVRGSVSAWATSSAKYFAGIALFNPDSGDTNYYELCLYNNVPPFPAIQGPGVGTLTNEAGARLGPYLTRDWRDFGLFWEPQEGAITYVVDGIIRQKLTGLTLQAHPVIWLGCVSVGENVGNDGSSARALFGPLEVVGVRV